jgi:hypothetical protein
MSDVITLRCNNFDDRGVVSACSMASTVDWIDFAPCGIPPRRLLDSC